MSIVFGLIIAIALLLLIAFPERLIPDNGERRKRVGGTYWGSYPGRQSTETEEEETIEAVTIKKKDGVMAARHMLWDGESIPAAAAANKVYN